MPSLSQVLSAVGSDRARDPLAPVTFVVPSHIAGLQLRRRLAARGPFAAVRFETLPRLAELLGAAGLAAAGRAPLARPIGDYAAQEVARLAQGNLRGVADLPGFGRSLRAVFRRLKRGGITSAAEVASVRPDEQLREVFRLYGLFMEMTTALYDDEDLMRAAAAALASGAAGVVSDLGAVYVVPPAGETAAAAELLEALAARATSFTRVDEGEARPSVDIILAPDPASEAHEVTRAVGDSLASGLAFDEIAVFHGADASYPRLLREAFERAGIPAAPMPGIPLIETPAGRGILALASLPGKDFSRADVIDFLGISPIRGQLPATGGPVPALVSAWDRLSRAAGVTHGSDRWQRGLEMLIQDREAAIQNIDPAEEARRETRQAEVVRARQLRDFIEELVRRLEALRPRQPAKPFIEAFKAIVHDYIRRDAPALEKVEAEIDQLGTVGAIGGSFTLESFTRALRANLEIAVERDRSFGDGILIADYRLAAGLEFRRVVVAGAYDGGFPGGPGADTLLSDEHWRDLRRAYPLIEDATLRLERGRAAANRAIATADSLTWSAPLNQANAGGEFFPAPQVVAAAQTLDPAVTTASALRTAGSQPWLRRVRSPLAAVVTGAAAEAGDVRIREAVRAKRSAMAITPGHALSPALSMLRARRSGAFSEWDGNLAGLDDPAWLALTRTVSPTSLEQYAACGFRYLGRSLLRLNVVEETEERETMDPAERGTLVHDVLDTFFREKQSEGRPRVGEAWTAADADRLLEVLDGHLGAARKRGRTGLDLYAGYEARNLRADLRAFLEADTDFRRDTGAVPTGFEVEIPTVEVAGVSLRGYADRIDTTPNGQASWVIDYKTGSASPYLGMNETNPLMDGTKLQLPVYLEAAPGQQVTGLYWLISRRAEFVKKLYKPSSLNQERFALTLEAIVGGIRAGAFPAVSGEEQEFYSGFVNCRFCDFDRLCSRRRDHEAAAKQDDPAFQSWRAVGRRARGEPG